MIDEKVTRHAAPLRTQVVEKIRNSIINGQFSPGSRLKERELIAMLDVSRTVIREALRQLETENLIVIEPQKGPKVKEISEVEVKEIYQVRKTLEILAVQLFIENSSDAAAFSLSESNDKLLKAFSAESPKNLYEAKNAFFETIFEQCGNMILKNLLKSLTSQLWRLRIMGLSHPDRNPERQERSQKNLLKLYEAIQSRHVGIAESVTQIEVDDARDEALRLI
jgi:DNA-binding GntR family transcriptional regulator